MKRKQGKKKEILKKKSVDLAHSDGASREALIHHQVMTSLAVRLKTL